MSESEGKSKVRTRQKRGHQRRVEEILLRLANIPDLPAVGTVVTENSSSLADFQRRFPNTAVSVRTEHLLHFQRHYPDIFSDFSEAGLRALKDLVRQAWQSDPRSREWFCFLIRKCGADISRLKREFDSDAGQSLLASWKREKETIDNLVKSGRYSPSQMIYNVRNASLIDAARQASPPEMSAFEQTFLHLQRNLRRAMVCRSLECPAPYFFRIKTGQLFCSTECHQQAKRARDRDWWSRNRSKKEGV